jgi:hypothetical protein
MQHGYVVRDVAAAARQWAQRVGAGPFYVLDRLKLDDYYYRGKQTPVELRLAFGYWGSIQIELIEPLDQTDTPYRQALQESEGQLNHCAVVVPNLDALIAERGLKAQVLQHGKMPTGLVFAYIEGYLPGGQHLELIEMQEATRQAFAGMEAASQRWDGADPVRSIARLQQDLTGR